MSDTNNKPLTAAQVRAMFAAKDETESNEHWQRTQQEGESVSDSPEEEVSLSFEDFWTKGISATR